ncbi:hypothetical protein [Tsuneonella troitsensis]|nr:hypothetical protein [Tsuneonella troitsensis]
MTDEDLAVIFILHPGDRAQDLASIRGRAFENWEFIHAESGWFEAVFVLDDYGHGHAVLLPDKLEYDPYLLTICREHAATDC